MKTRNLLLTSFLLYLCPSVLRKIESGRRIRYMPGSETVKMSLLILLVSSRGLIKCFQPRKDRVPEAGLEKSRAHLIGCAIMDWFLPLMMVRLANSASSGLSQFPDE